MFKLPLLFILIPLSASVEGNMAPAGRGQCLPIGRRRGYYDPAMMLDRLCANRPRDRPA